MKTQIKVGDKITSNSNCTTLKAGDEATVEAIYTEEKTGEIFFGLFGKTGKLPGVLSIENAVLLDSE